jgi:hypothetical protein
MSEPRDSQPKSVTSGPASRTPALAGAGAALALAIALGVGCWSPREGRVAFEVKPPAAEVAVLLPEGGRLVLSGPAGAPTVLQAGTHRAEVSAPGFETQAVEFEVVGGKTKSVSVALARARGAVAFEIEPARAELVVTPSEGGEARALPLVEGRWKGELETGEYVARVTASGFDEKSVPFVVSQGEPTLLPITLRGLGAGAPRGGTVVVPAPAPRYYGPGYYGPGYYGPGYYGPGYYGPRGVPRPPRPRFR